MEHLEKALRTYEELGDVLRAAEIHVALGNDLLAVAARAENIPRAADHLHRAEAVLSKGPENSSLAFLYFCLGQLARRRRSVWDAVAAYRR